MAGAGGQHPNHAAGQFRLAVEGGHVEGEYSIHRDANMAWVGVLSIGDQHFVLQAMAGVQLDQIISNPIQFAQGDLESLEPEVQVP